MATRYFIHLPDPGAARGNDGELAFTAHGADAFAEQLQVALRGDDLYRRWKARQPDDENDDADDDADDADRNEVDRDDPLAATDPAATVHGEPNDLGIDLVVTTTLSGHVLRHRLRILAGPHWELRDVRAG